MNESINEEGWGSDHACGRVDSSRKGGLTLSKAPTDAESAAEASTTTLGLPLLRLQFSIHWVASCAPLLGGFALAGEGPIARPVLLPTPLGSDLRLCPRARGIALACVFDAMVAIIMPSCLASSRYTLSSSCRPLGYGETLSRARPATASVFLSSPPPSHLSCSSAWPSKRPDFHDLGLKGGGNARSIFPGTFPSGKYQLFCTKTVNSR